MVSEMKSIYGRLADIQVSLKAPKGQFNNFAKYNYRSAEDILEAVKPLLNGLVLTITDDVVQIGDRYYVCAHAVLTDGNHDIKVNGYAREAQTKIGMDESQITGAASSYARKYALNGLFAIDDGKDADSDDNRPTKKTPAKTEAPANRSVKSNNVQEAAKARAKEMREQDQDKVTRDSNGKTYDAKGHMVPRNVEAYSLEHFGEVLCYDCQKIRKAENAKA